MFEELGEISQFQFKTSSIEQYDCQNYELDANAYRFNSFIQFTIRDLIQPSECETGMAPAKNTSSIGFLPNGDYNVQISLKNTISNQGKLQVTADAFTLKMESLDGIELASTELKRIPAKSIWGYVGYQNKDEVGNQPELFIQDLKNSSLTINLPQGEYGYFKIENNGQLILNPPPKFTFFQTFLFKYDKNLQELESLLEAYRMGPANGKMEIKVFTWEGESF